MIDAPLPALFDPKLLTEEFALLIADPSSFPPCRPVPSECSLPSSAVIGLTSLVRVELDRASVRATLISW